MNHYRTSYSSHILLLLEKIRYNYFFFIFAASFFSSSTRNCIDAMTKAFSLKSKFRNSCGNL
nr:MAG TPA: hypothetical protein [Caudoviricetes sp.]DAY63195.1 MAG TPA: hypothetical protein [Caudoviricetes sp.]DAY80490.1 MAG TPA: hypothetical protein [Caudoviricetes sp.]